MVGCKERCEWEAYCANFPKEGSWKLWKVFEIHNCSIDYNVKMMTAKWLSKRIQNSLKVNPIKKIKDIKEKAQMKGNVGVNKTKEIRGICGARSMVYGSFLE